MPSGSFSVELGEYPQQDQQDAYIYLTNKCVCVCISQIEKAGMLSTKISEFFVWDFGEMTSCMMSSQGFS